MRFRSALCLCLAALSIAFAATPAWGLTPLRFSESEFPGFSASFHLEGTHGYRIDVFAYSHSEGGHGRIFIGVTRGRESAFYNAPAILSDAFLRADLGTLGKIDLAFHTVGGEKTIPIKCSHHTFTYQPGLYEGLVEFNGEEGFTRARATSVPLDPLFGSICGSGSGYGEAFGPSEPGADLRGLSFAHGRALSFEVKKNGPKARTFFEASLRERRGGISIRRSVSGAAPANAFVFDRSLRRAEPAPPAPFTGSAFLLHSPGTLFPSWKGSLAIEFPGHKVRAAGPSVHVSIRHVHFTQSGNGTAEIGI